MAQPSERIVTGIGGDRLRAPFAQRIEPSAKRVALNALSFR